MWFSVFLAGAVHGQWPSLPADSAVDLTLRWRHWIAVEGSLDLNANTLDNGMVFNFVEGGHLDRSLRERNSARMGTHNTGGYLAHGSVAWTGSPGLFGKTGWRPLVSASVHEVVGLKFTRDLFDLTFFGNAPYAGQTMQAGPAAHVRMGYETLGFGVRDVHSRSFIRLDVVKGRSYSGSDVAQADLLTATDGRRIDLRMNGALWQSDTAYTGFDAWNGIGAAISGTWAILRPGPEKPLDLRIGVQDLGVVQWSDGTMHLEKDSSWAYEGFQVSNVLALDDILLDQDHLMDSLGLAQRTGTHTTLLPFQVHLNADLRAGARWNLGLGAMHVYLPGYSPQITLSGARTFGTCMQWGLGAVYGGFGGFRVSLAGRFRMGQHTLLTIATPSVAGFAGGETMGLGALVGLTVGW